MKSRCTYFANKRVVEDFEEFLSVKLESNKSLSAVNYHNGYIVPSIDNSGCGVLDENGGFVDNSALHESFRKVATIPDEDVQYYNEDVIYVGCLISIFGHAITDNIKKLWYLKTLECKRLIDNGAKIVYLAYGNQTLSPYVMKIIELYGIDMTKLRCVRSVGQYRGVIVPDNSMFIEGRRRFFTPVFKETVECIVKGCGQCDYKTFDKIYMSRTCVDDNKDFGEKRIEQEFEKRGYEIIHPETLPIEQQIWLVKNCSHFAATIGSVSHLSLFCRDDVDVCLLMKARYINEYQCMMDCMNNVNVTYIDVSHTIGGKDAWKGPFYLSKTKWLGKYFNVRYYDVPLIDETWYSYVYNYLKMLLLNEYSLLLQKHRWLFGLRNSI